MNTHFIKFADLPPNPLDPQALAHYKQLGLNTFLLTEDDVKLIRDGRLNPDYLQAIENISAQGLQVWIRNMYNDPDYFDCPAHKTGSNYGTPYELEPRHITDEFAAYPAVSGFYMADEAYMYTLPERIHIDWMRPDCHLYPAFDQLTRVVDWKNRYYPDTFFHMNHVPSASWDHYLPKDGRIYSYEDFLTCYADTVLRRLKGCGRSLCLDNYPFIGDNYLETDYLFDLLTAAKVTRAYNASSAPEDRATFGLCIQTFEATKLTYDGRKRDITMPEEVTLQMYVGMALGARLFEYFCYRSFGHELAGILDPEEGDRIYSLVRTAGERVQYLEPVLCELESSGAFMVPGSLYSFNTAAMVMARDLFCRPYEFAVESQYDTLVGCLSAPGRKAYMLVNYTDPIRHCTGTVTLHTGSVPQLTLWQDGKQTLVNTQNGRLTLTLAPGGAALVSWPEGA